MSAAVQAQNMPHLRNPKVSELDHVVLCKEDVLGLEVAMKNVLVMHVLESQGDLDEPRQNVRLWKVPHLSLFDQGRQISALTESHDNA